MKKLVGIIFPYIISGIVYLLSTIQFDYDIILKSLIVGGLIGMWYYCISSSDGTKAMMIAITINIIIFVVGVIVVCLLGYLKLLHDVVSIMCILVSLECVALYIVNKNVPRLSMTYKYSYKNKRRRYF